MHHFLLQLEGDDLGLLALLNVWDANGLCQQKAPGKDEMRFATQAIVFFQFLEPGFNASEPFVLDGEIVRQLSKTDFLQTQNPILSGSKDAGRNMADATINDQDWGGFHLRGWRWWTFTKGVLSLPQVRRMARRS